MLTEMQKKKLSMLKNSPVGDLGKDLDYEECTEMGTTAALGLLCHIWEETADLSRT